MESLQEQAAKVRDREDDAATIHELDQESAKWKHVFALFGLDLEDPAIASTIFLVTQTLVADLVSDVDAVGTEDALRVFGERLVLAAMVAADAMPEAEVRA